MDKYQCCRILQVSENITKEELKLKYKKLILKFHPDRNKELGANERFIKIKDAYEQLVKILENPTPKRNVIFYPGDWIVTTPNGYATTSGSWTFTFSNS